MKGMELRGFLRVAQGNEARLARLGARGPRCFLQEYDSIEVKGWGCAKNMILWELGERGKQLTTDSLQSTAGKGRSESVLMVDPSGTSPTVLPSGLRVSRASSLK